jgi:hypothetical protein
MALSQKHRAALYEHFLPQVGEDVTEALLAEFPAGEGDELVTKTFLRAELAELRGEMAELRGGLRSEMAAMRVEMHELAAATNRRLTTVALGVTGVLITAGGVMTSVAVAAVR